ncbi:MotA/TolQ/ExbB proton channel [Thermosinus carboxydivorans Nor1]|uniref:MotA/TolQ/ExbB proton channel n=1 Tax=Thermosinus carboxydivorans Nor1 TaxID=401526 RepID=A1HN30_9FIRM|nr:flagellar motor protein [Thermosinus carboxydivorans]EAX48658.1 MotA/TolQ/ExbB proton channel [Thermosinus carboxydivorans Nor1]
MDLMTILGLALGLTALLLSVVLEGGHITSLFSLPAFVLVFGGTIGATAVCFTLEELKSVPALLRIAFKEEKYDTGQLIATLVGFAEKARREGLLALEEDLAGIEDNFLQKGMQLVIDGTDAELVRSIMETELTFIQERHHKAASIFETAGGYAPTMGIIGTVMGLVHVLGNLTDTESLGPAIATAFIATLYGVASANIFFLPIGAKLKNRSSRQVLFHEVTLEGILSVQAGDNPRIVAEKLAAFLAPKQREIMKRDKSEA